MKNTPKLIARAQQLRKNPTKAEKLLWSKLRKRRLEGIKFRRQHPIQNYIVDFISLKKKLIIEIDGCQHNKINHKNYDLTREKGLK